jgi:hypothetical protein
VSKKVLDISLRISYYNNMTNKRKALIDKLNAKLDAMVQAVIHKDYNLESPEVQHIPIYSLRLNIGEARLIRDLLTTYNNSHLTP